MLINSAKEAGIKVPADPDNYDAHEFPHFHVFCVMQLGKPMPHTDSVWTNAKVVASVADDQIKTITPPELLALGFEIGRPIP